MRSKLPAACIVGGVLAVGPWLWGPGATALHAAEGSSTTADDPAFKRLAEVDVGPLESPNQGRTLPFQVPFVVKGTVDRNAGASKDDENKIVGLRVHLIEAKRPIRVEEDEESLRCYHRGPGRDLGRWRFEWSKDSLGGYSDYRPEKERCGLVVDAGYWSAPEPLPVDAQQKPVPEIEFSLVMPPVEAGRYYALGFQIQRTLSNRQVDEIFDLLIEEAGFDSLFQAENLEDFFANACPEILGYAERNDVVLDARGSTSAFRLCLPTEEGSQPATHSRHLFDELSDQETYKAQEGLVKDLLPELENAVKAAGEALPGLDVSDFRWPEEPSSTERLQALQELKQDAGTAYESITQELEGCECTPGSACRAKNETACDARDLVGSIEEAADKAIEYLAPRISTLRQAIRESVVWLGTSTVYDFNSRQKMYLSADVGFVAGIGEVSEVVPYLGTNIYFKAVNKEAPLGSLKRVFSKKFLSEIGLRCGVTIGATLEGLDDDRTRTDLFSDMSLVGGGGCRITEAVRLGAGWFVYKELDPNPLIDDEDLETAPYVSLSVDWDVRSLFQGIDRIFSSFFGSGGS